ncbi:G-protein coupled receptor Mth2-like [Sipha flava]|uniref:G-protein coupled receptor Mth2-like n=1 Tax=Sipha flava TaxID=143950 RepID=A0A8B8FF59_9HEMI|nr:G-protein coupled receptor Mth2-like [Sipha flava]
MTGRPERSPTKFSLLVLALLLLTPVVASSTNATDVCPYVPVTDGTLVDGGFLLAGNPRRRYSSSQYRPSNGSYEVKKPCVFKCCKMGRVRYDKGCGPSNYTFEKLAVLKSVNDNGSIELYESDQFHLVLKKIICNNNVGTVMLKPSKVKSFGITEDGRLNYGSNVAPGQFCIDRNNENGSQLVIVMCAIENKQTASKIYNIVALIISLPFLFVTLLVYALIVELQNLHGKSLMCYTATLIVAFTSLIIDRFINSIDQYFCILMGVFIQFFSLASFFWLNIMCFDLWWTFSGFRLLKRNLKQHESKKFKMYSIYAWGCTTFISAFTYYMQIVYSSSQFSPGFGIRRCWFNTKLSTFIYFYGPVTILSSSDILMFIHTAVLISKRIQDTKIINHPDCKRKIDHEKQRFVLYLKLFIVMGINWMAEILSWAFEDKDSSFNILWIITDFGNALQGVLIFVIFVCRKRVLRLLSEKLCPRMKLFKKSTTSSTKTRYSSTISKTTTVS